MDSVRHINYKETRGRGTGSVCADGADAQATRNHASRGPRCMGVAVVTQDDSMAHELTHTLLPIPVWRARTTDDLFEMVSGASISPGVVIADITVLGDNAPTLVRSLTSCYAVPVIGLFSNGNSSAIPAVVEAGASGVVMWPMAAIGDIWEVLDDAIVG